VVGYLGFGAAAASENRVAALRAGLRDVGYVEGKTIKIEFRWAETVGQLNEFAAELVRLKVDVIYAQSSTETAAARRATTTIPIVFATHADPVGLGHIASLARPGGNITGLSVLQSDLTIKALEILKEVVPNAKRFGILWSPSAPSYRPTLEAARKAGKSLDVETSPSPQWRRSERTRSSRLPRPSVASTDSRWPRWR
jgi:putative tryptophan/tyrosine transport system substrate-binding protein